MYRLFGRKGWGSALTELQLAWYGLPYQFEEVGDLFASEDARRELAKVNPVAQLPTLVLPDGTVMTESAAITLHLADITGSSELVPPAGDPARPDFLRWLVFTVANIYPTFTYADDPARFVTGQAAQKAFRDSVDAYAIRLWRMMEDAAVGPCFLGERFSAIDIYIAVMTRWRPRRAWFAEHAPRLSAIALAAEAQPRLAAICAKNFAEDGGS
ncbi:MAG TPA: glutathione S-transferase [Alphaproteobacteria bacterium]|jgi:GST-like protein|nr:glutathione S-transferase [Alphaproteobacteria bacterium]